VVYRGCHESAPGRTASATAWAAAPSQPAEATPAEDPATTAITSTAASTGPAEVPADSLMTDLFKSLQGGLGRFVLGWLVPSAVAVGLYVLFAVPGLVRRWPSLKGTVPKSPNGLIGVGVFTLAVLTLTVIFAYASLPIYRLLEGYTLPRPLAKVLLRKQLREWRRLQIMAGRTQARHNRRAINIERLQDYPERREYILPTRLGNAFRAMETYGSTRYLLDSQTLWYELQAVIPSQLRSDVVDGRASVDFFISAVSHCILLAVTSGSAFLAAGDLSALWLAIGSAVLVRPAYLGAVKNMADYRFSVQAAVNLGRLPLATSLGFTLPQTVNEEMQLWATVTAFISGGHKPEYRRILNRYRSI
jgi:hypothetical protein